TSDRDKFPEFELPISDPCDGAAKFKLKSTSKSSTSSLELDEVETDLDDEAATQRWAGRDFGYIIRPYLLLNLLLFNPHWQLIFIVIVLILIIGLAALRAGRHCGMHEQTWVRDSTDEMAMMSNQRQKRGGLVVPSLR
ncbi:hypothetical protein JZ751_004922, partial [Albula glossodonta]